MKQWWKGISVSLPTTRAFPSQEPPRFSVIQRWLLQARTRLYCAYRGACRTRRRAPTSAIMVRKRKLSAFAHGATSAPRTAGWLSKALASFERISPNVSTHRRRRRHRVCAERASTRYWHGGDGTAAAAATFSVRARGSTLPGWDPNSARFISSLKRRRHMNTNDSGTFGGACIRR